MSFKKGKSGNPSGRPRGVIDRRVELRELLLPHAADLIEKAVAMAKAGDTTALRICLDRLVPPIKAKDQAVKLELPAGQSPAEFGKAVLDAMGTGRITPDEASTFMQAIAAQTRIIEVDELQKRVAALETRNAQSN